jgi:hypothetical protein
MNASKAQQDGSERVALELLLPEALIWQALEWLPFWQRRRFFSCCKSLWRTRSDYESKIQSLLLPHPPPFSCLCNLGNLQTLDLGCSSSDEFLQELCSELALPNLTNLLMARSMQVTDRGLELLTHNPVRCKMLQTIDITFCRRTTYEGTFVLRDNLVSLKLLRRQPQWMDGLFETPFANDHLHSYWADGTFSFARDSLATGFVCDIFEWESLSQHHVGDKVQYSDFDDSELDTAWPTWAKLAYRPGVSLLRIPGERAVLVAQRLQGLYPPRDCPKLHHVDIVPRGQSMYLDKEGHFLDQNHNDEEQRHTMISHVPMQPLEQIMPPLNIVQKNRAYLERRAAREEIQNETSPELKLHLALGGQLSDWHDVSSKYNHENGDNLP